MNYLHFLSKEDMETVIRVRKSLGLKSNKEAVRQIIRMYKELIKS